MSNLHKSVIAKIAFSRPKLMKQKLLKNDSFETHKKISRNDFQWKKNRDRQPVKDVLDCGS
jgi:hypothetical protein